MWFALLLVVVSGHEDALVKRTEEFWSTTGVWADVNRVESYFAAEGELCFFSCSKGQDAIKEAVQGWTGLLGSIQVTVTQYWRSEDDDFVYISGKFVDGLLCPTRGPPTKVYQLTGHTYLQIVKGTELVLKEMVIVDSDDFAKFATECSGGVASVPIDKARLRRIADEDLVRWNLLMTKDRVQTDPLETFSKFTTPDFEICYLGFGGCHDSVSNANAIKAFQAIISDMNLKYNRLLFAPNQIGIEWSGAYVCPHGGPPMSVEVPKSSTYLDRDTRF